LCLAIMKMEKSKENNYTEILGGSEIGKKGDAAV
jgi:hypothetical protein